MPLEQAITELNTTVRELIAALNGVNNAVTTTTSPKKDSTDPKPDTKPTTEPTPTASDSSENSSTESKQADAPAKVEYADIQKLVPQIAKTSEGTEKVVALFGRYGVRRGPELKAEQYDAFFADLQKVEAGELDPRTAEV